MCADHSDPPTLLEKKEAHEVRTKCPQLDWYNQQLYQVLALSCKGEALAMIKALAAGEHEGTRGVTAWYRLTRDHRGSSAQRILGLVGRVFQPQRCVKMSDISSHLELWESRIREYEKLVFQTEKIQTKVPDSCKVFIVRSMVPKGLDNDLLKIHPTANYKTTKEYILEQASLERDAHFDDEGNHDKPVPMEVDALLAKVTALREGRGECDEASDGKESHLYDSCGGRPQHQEEETWSDHSSVTLDQIEKELMALKGNKGGKGGKGGKGKGFQGYCNYCGKYGHRLNECWAKDQDMKAKGGSWSNKGKRTKGQKGHWKGLEKRRIKDHSTMVNSFTTDTGKAAVQFGKPREEPGNMLLQEVGWEGARQRTPRQRWNVLVRWSFLQGGSQDGGGTWQAVSSNPWTSKLFSLEDEPPGLELKNSFGALVETDLEEEIPMISYDDFPLMSCGFECEKKIVPRRGKFNTKTQKQKKEARGKSKPAPKTVSTGGQELHPLIWVEDNDDHPGLHAVSDSSRWMSVCPTTGFTRVKSVLDSGATDSCAPDCMCPEVKSRPSDGSRRGQMFSAAGGKKIANEGEKDITMVTGNSKVVQTNWQTVDITRPLSSVRQICLQGNRVLFGAQGGVIYNIESGQETPFGIEDDIYVLDLWLPPSPTRGFGRQG